jgi:ribosomal protein S18 acetylase RimI-like enzyme
MGRKIVVKIEKQELGEAAKMLLDLEKRILVEKYHNPFQNTGQVIEFYKESEIYFSYLGNTPVGFMACQRTGEVSELLGLGVLPKYQRQGIGKKMLFFFMEREKKRDLTLVVHPYNAKALIMYLNTGWRITGYRENYYGDGQPRVVLNYPAINGKSAKK